jgi:predicted Zn-dependent peptidase
LKKHVYPNGLTLIIDEAPQLMSVAVAAWVKTGTRHEDLDSWGMSHFMEHMIFKGSKKRGAMEISKAVDRVGGDFNAFTSREHTCFHFFLPAREMKLGATLLKEMLFHPLFAAKEIEKERQVILQEIAMVKENPEEDSFDRFIEKCFGKHPLGRNILGSAESISKLNRKKVFAFFYQHYRPENMVLAISGAVSFEKARREFAALGSGAWPNRKNTSALPARWGMDPPEGTVPGFYWMDSDTEQAHILMGIPAPVKSGKDRVIATILQQHLGGGMSSVLFDQIREKKGWAYSVYASAIHFLDASVFTLYAGVKTERVMDTIRVFKSEMAKIAKHGIPSTELKRIQDSLLCSYELSMESSESRMMTISNSELFFKRDLGIKEYAKLVRSVKVKDIQKLMHHWLKAGDSTIFVLGKKPGAPKQRKQLISDALRLTKQSLIFEK